MARVSGNKRGSSWKKWAFWGAAGLMIAGVGSRLFVSTIEALIDHEVTIDLVMTVVVVLVIAAGMVFFVKYFRELGDFDYDPPLGKSPSMPGYYEEHYEGRDVRVNAYGELVPAGGPGDPMNRKAERRPLRGAPQAYSAAAGAAEQYMVTPVAPGNGTPGAGNAAGSSAPARKKLAKNVGKRKVRGYIKAGRAVDAEVEVGPTLRADGTTKFGPDRQWGYFPAVSLRWNIVDEPWMESTHRWLSMLSVRPSWGRVGNQPNRDYLYESIYSSDMRYINMGAMKPENIRLTDLRWETTTTWDVGFDLGHILD